MAFDAFNPIDGAFSAARTNPYRVSPDQPVFVQQDPYYLDDEGMGVDYGARYVKQSQYDPYARTPGYTSSYGSRGSRLSNEDELARVRDNEAVATRRMSDSKDEVARYLASGYKKAITELGVAVSDGDTNKVQNIIKGISAFRNNNAKELADWARYADGSGGGPAVAQLAKTASAILTDDYMDTPLVTGVSPTGQPLRNGVTAGFFLETGLNFKAKDVDTFLTDTYPQKVDDLARYAKLMDLSEIERIHGELNDFVKGHAAELRKWANYGAMPGSPIGAKMAENAQKLLEGEYLNTKITYGTETDPVTGKPMEYSVRQLVGRDPLPKQLERQLAGNWVRDYDVSYGFASLAADRTNPMSPVMDTLIRGVDTGVAWQKNGETDRGVRQVQAYRAAMQTISQHYDNHNGPQSTGYPADDATLANFYSKLTPVITRHGMSVSQVDDVYNAYSAQLDKSEFSPDRFFRDLEDAYNGSLVPTVQVNVPGENGKESKTVSLSSTMADPGRISDAVLDVSRRMDGQVGLNRINKAVAAAAHQVDEVERAMGASFADLGFGDMVATTAAYALSGQSDAYRVAARSGTSADLLTYTQSRFALATSTLARDAVPGADGTDTLESDTGYLNTSAAAGLAAAFTRAAVKNFNDLQSGNTGAATAAIRKELTESLGQSYRGMSEELRGKIADRFLDNMENGRRESLGTMLKQFAGKFSPVAASGEPDAQRKTVTLAATGEEVPAGTKPPADTSTDGVSMTGEGLRGEPGRRSRAALDALISGSSPLFVGMKPQACESVQNLATKIRDTIKLNKYNGSITDDTRPAREDASRVMSITAAIAGLDSIFNDKYVQSGGLLAFLEGDDKFNGVSTGGIKEIESAAYFANKLVNIIRDTRRPASERSAAASLFSEITVEIYNRSAGMFNFYRAPDRTNTEGIIGSIPQGGFPAEYDHARLGTWGPELSPAGFLLNEAGVYPAGIVTSTILYDSEYLSERNRIRSIISSYYSIPESDVLASLGYNRTHQGEKWDRHDYGGILGAFERLRNGQVGLAVVVDEEPDISADASPGTPHTETSPAPPAGALPAPADTDRMEREANAWLKKTTSTSEEFNRQEKILLMNIQSSCLGDQKLVEGQAPALVAMFRSIWRAQGPEAAKKFVSETGQKAFVYTEVPDPATGERSIKLVPVSGQQLRQLGGGDIAAAIRSSIEYQKEYERGVRAQQAEVESAARERGRNSENGSL